MKRLLCLLIPLFCCLAVWGQNGNVNCHQGDQKQQAADESTAELGASATSVQVRSADPNEIIGPVGYDSVRWVSINDVLNYTIFFENDPDFATAAAQRADVRFGFDDKLWMRGFGIGGYSFANMSYPVANWPNAYQERINLRDSLGFFVDMIAGLDVVQQQGFWNFTTIDPETGYTPWQADMGMLPVNDSTHVGEGLVTFRLKPYEGLVTGDTISIQAYIVFDQNDTIPTNRWCNMIDAGMPQSTLHAVIDPSNPNVYLLTCEAQDDPGGSGVKHVLIYLANHSGVYEEVDTIPVGETVSFPVEPGKQYMLYSIAVDNTGNREPAKEQSDVVLNFNQAPTDILLSNNVFQDDLPAGGFIGRLTTVDSKESQKYTYALAEGDGSTHNDLFQITDDQLQVKQSFKNATETVYHVRISSTDEGGMTFSKPFELKMVQVLEHPEADTVNVTMCEGDSYLFHGEEYDQAGTFVIHQENEHMGDSVYVLMITLLPYPETPTITVTGKSTLISSAAKGNQWYRDGVMIEGATEQTHTATESGSYSVTTSNGYCVSDMSDAVDVNLDAPDHMQIPLHEGWNWISAPNNNPELSQPLNFIQSVEDDVLALKSSQAEFTHVNGQWAGDLNEMKPDEGYKMDMSTSAVLRLEATPCEPDDVPITLQHGWTWISYVPQVVFSVQDALAGLLPNENDVIKSHSRFALYSTNKWIGTLDYMMPGEGYSYFNNGSTKSFNYPARRVSTPMSSPKLASDKLWSVNYHNWADNMTMVATLFINDWEAIPGTYTVGAFCGDECRGIAQWLEERIFMTVHGDLNDNIIFKVKENATGKSFLAEETIALSDTHHGNMSKPFVLHVIDDSGVSETVVEQSYNIYPNPVRQTLYINGPTENIISLQVLSVSGLTMLTSSGYKGGLDVTSLDDGVYVLCIRTAEGMIYKKFMKVAS